MAVVRLSDLPDTRVVLDAFHEAERLAKAAAIGGNVEMISAAVLSLIGELRVVLVPRSARD